MADENVTTGSTIKFELDADKDGETWDLTDATVTFYLTDPSGNRAEYAGTIDSAASGLASYTVATSVLNKVGTWKRQWKVVQSTVTLWTTPREFYVSLGAPVS